MTEKRFSSHVGHDYDKFTDIIQHYRFQQALVATRALSHWYSQGGNTTIVELGCGSGLTTQAIYNIAPQATVIAVDNEPQMVADLRRKADLRTHLKSERLQLKEADAIDYLCSLTPNSVGVIATSFMAHNFKRDERNKLHQQAWRVLRPGGVFVNMDKIAQDDTREHFDAMRTYLDKLVAGYRALGLDQVADEWITHYQIDNMPDRIQIESVVKSDLSNAGFSKVDISDRILTDALITATK